MNIDKLTELDDLFTLFLPDVIDMVEYAMNVDENIEFHIDSSVERLKSEILKKYTSNDEVERLVAEARVDELDKRIAVWESPRKPQLTEINQDPSVAWDNGHNSAVNTIITGAKQRLTKLQEKKNEEQTEK